MDKTRKASRCCIFGNIEELRGNTLPTYKEVMKFYNFVRYQVKLKTETRKEPAVADIAEIVAARLESIWQKASIGTVTHSRIIQLIRAYHSKCKNLIKSWKRLPDDKKEQFLSNSNKLFDISSCKCKYFQHCKCSKERKIAKEEWIFLTDQRTERKMVIGGLDISETKKIEKRNDRNQKLELYYSSVRNREKQNERLELSAQSPVISDESDADTTGTGDNLGPSSSKLKMSKKNTNISLPSLSKTCDRYGVSDRAAAAIASAVLHDIKSDVGIIDRSKLRRERAKERKEMLANNQVLSIPALFFDGRKDKVLKIVKKGVKKYRQVTVEEHISVIKEPDSVYVGYAVPNTGTAKSIELAICDLLSSEKISLRETLAIGCDGTAINTGKKGGVIRLLEKRLNQPLQWIICLLHTNELPLKHLFSHLDGATTGPTSYSGTIGRLLEKCEEMDIVQYEKIYSVLPYINPDIVKDLSSDQRYLYDITSAVISGECPSDLANRAPGKMSHARWLTKASRILRLYISTSTTSDNLKHLATFVVRVYAPVWFQIKTHPSCKDGSKHFWKLVTDSRYLPSQLKEVVDPVIERNSFFAHSENILLSMLSDPEKHTRELAARRILKARHSIRTEKLPRAFEVPKINFNARSYTDLIDWQQKYFEPPILKYVKDEDLLQMVEAKGNKEIPYLRIPCHTQAVERCVKTLTDVSMQACDKKSREGLMKSKMESRKLMPKFDTKRDFNV